MAERNQSNIERAILQQEVIALRDRLIDKGINFADILDDDAIINANSLTLRKWKSDFDHLLRSLSAGGQ